MEKIQFFLKDFSPTSLQPHFLVKTPENIEFVAEIYFQNTERALFSIKIQIASAIPEEGIEVNAKAEIKMEGNQPIVAEKIIYFTPYCDSDKLYPGRLFKSDIKRSLSKSTGSSGIECNIFISTIKSEKSVTIDKKSEIKAQKKVEESKISPPKQPKKNTVNPSTKSTILNNSIPVGLLNQGATCYMNSVLQILFHIPIFRKIIYAIPTDDVPDMARSIPLNLQCLFFNMQTSKCSCSTKYLTDSFGWTHYETFEQHDVQDFIRTLIDTLEEQLKDSNFPKEIAEIFRGECVTYIRNLHIAPKLERERTDPFVDLSIPVKDLTTIESSFDYYKKPEELVGDNQYITDEGKKVDAIKGTEILNLPPVLQIHLRRFEFDYITSQPRKLNSRFQFGRDLDLSSTLSKKADKSQCTEYELFGVIVHVGDTGCGHYYAYIRVNCGDDWYRFDDSHVTIVHPKNAIEDNFGGYSTYYIGEKTYNAYLLFYVRKDQKNYVFCDVPIVDIPLHITRTAAQQEKYNFISQKNASKITFSLFTDDTLRENAMISRLGFKNSNPVCTIQVDYNSPNSDLYEIVGQSLKLTDDYVIYTMRNDYTVDRAIKPNDGIVNNISRILYVRKLKNKSFEAHFKTNRRLVFIFFFTKAQKAPIVFIKSSLILDSNDLKSVQKKIKNYIGIDDSTKFDSYVYSSTGLNQVHSMSILHGLTIIFSSPMISDAIIDEKIISRFIPTETNKKSKKIISYFELTDNFPTNPERYFKELNDMCVVDVYSFDDIDNKMTAIQLPKDIFADDIAKLLLKIYDIPKYDTNKNSLLLFEQDIPKFQPKTKPGTYFMLREKKSIYYYYETHNRILTGFALTIEYSKDAKTTSKRFAVYVSTYSKYEDIISSHTFLATSSPRFLEISDNRITKIYKSSDYIKEMCNGSYLRIERIPKSQRNIEKHERLVRVCHKLIDDTGKLYPDGFPFMIKINIDAKLEDAYEVIAQAVGKPVETVKNYRFIVNSSYSYIHSPDKYLKRTTKILDALTSDNDLAIVHSDNDEYQHTTIRLHH